MTSDSSRPIPFHLPSIKGKELDYISQALTNGRVAGDGEFTRRCNDWLEDRSGTVKALLTHSCTAALEMAALLLDLAPGDEVIMPSYTFVSTANAFVLRGAVPVFVDIRPDTLNIDETLIEHAITLKTRAIAVVHYAGVACAMDEILALARQYGLPVIEDAAQGLGASYKGRALGSIGLLGAYSFHETKNIISGEGGALLVNGGEELVKRAEIIREKGTDRKPFLRGEVDKYTWQDVGSSFLPSEIVAAFLYAQFENADALNEGRMSAWKFYDEQLASLEQANLLRRPTIPQGCVHNAHMYYVIMPTTTLRTAALDAFRGKSIKAPFHYIPLHSSPAGMRFSRTSGELTHTDDLAARIIRLPMFTELERQDQRTIIDLLASVR